MYEDEVLNELAQAVRTHVPHQPWSFTGNKPVPVEIHFFGDAWAVRFVTGVRGERRVWARMEAPTLMEALQKARQYQERGF